MGLLKLAALDEEDLTVLSACVQDAVLKTGEISYSVRQKKLVLSLNRFAWEKDGEKLSVPERHRAILHFDRVLTVNSAGIDRAEPETVHSILALRYVAAQAPAGMIEIDLAGGATLRLGVECIEAQLSDLGPVWAAKGRPKHGS